MTERPVERDPGMPQERTDLAWRRTGTALLIATLLLGRLAMEDFGAIVVVPMVLVASTMTWVVTATTRNRLVTKPRAEDPTLDWVLADGRLPAAVAAVAIFLALGELVTALTT